MTDSTRVTFREISDGVLRPLVSVIIPTFNAGKYVAETLESVISQNVLGLEVVVADDGSTDDTLEVVSRYKITKLVKQSNCGPSAARNLGLRHSRGEYVWFLDADDLISPKAISRSIELITANPSTDATVGKWSFMDENGVTTSPCIQAPTSLFADNNRAIDDMVLRTLFPVGTSLIKRSAIDRVGGWDERLWCAEDRDLWIRLLRSGCKFAKLDEHVFQYRHHGSNATKNMPRIEKHVLLFLQKWFDSDENDGLLSGRLRPLAFSVAYFFIARQLLVSSDGEGSDERFVTAALKYLGEASLDRDQAYDILWESVNMPWEASVRMLMWSQMPTCAADFCCTTASGLIQKRNFRKAIVMLAEVVAKNPSMLVRRIARRLCRIEQKSF